MIALPSDTLVLRLTEFQRATGAFLERLTAREALRKHGAANVHRTDGGAMLVARPEHIESVIDHLLHQGVALPGAGPTTMLKDVKAGTRGGGRKAHQR